MTTHDDVWTDPLRALREMREANRPYIGFKDRPRQPLWRPRHLRRPVSEQEARRVAEYVEKQGEAIRQAGRDRKRAERAMAQEQVRIGKQGVEL